MYKKYNSLEKWNDTIVPLLFGRKQSCRILNYIIMCKLILGLTLLTFSLSAHTYSQTVTLTGKNVSASDFFEAINKQTGYSFVLKNSLINKITSFDINEKNTPLTTVLDKYLSVQGIDYSIKHKTIVLNDVETTTKQQETSVTGIVLTPEGSPIPGVSIKIKGQQTPPGVTRENGAFSISNLKENSTLVVSSIGYEVVELHIKKSTSGYSISTVRKTQAGQLKSESGDNIQLRLTLHPQMNQVEDVVVTGIFNKPKESFTGAATTISKEQLRMSGNRNLLKTIGNIDPSFDLQENNIGGSDPNQLPNIEIRGTSTIGNVADLQTNVRSSLNLPLFILDGFEVSMERVMDMNQADVEQVVILKDASATAIYGSRGSNGVVVITSLKPEQGKLRLTYGAGANFEFADLSSYHVFDAAGKLHIEELAGLYTTDNPSDQSRLRSLHNVHKKYVASGIDTDWKRIPVRTGIGHYHKIDLTGGDEQFRYILNGSYNQVAGAMKGSSRDNFNGGMTISYMMNKFRFTNNLSIGFNNSDNGNYGSYHSWVSMNPYLSPYDENGELIQTYPSFTTSSPQYNPLYTANLTSFSTSNYANIRNTLALDWDVFSGLKVNTSVGFNKQLGGSDRFTSPLDLLYLNFGDITTKGQYTQSKMDMQSYQFSGTVNYAKVFNDHSIYLGVNGQLNESQNDVNTIIVTGFVNDKMTDISNGLQYSGSHPTSIEKTTRSMGITGTINYNYMSRYYVDASYRLDGASSFGSHSRFAPFFSIGAGWTISQEPFIKDNLPFIDLMRLRYSYGVTGSLNFQPYQALTTYTYNNTDYYRNLIGATINSYGNENLRWQNTVQNNIGMDATILGGALLFSANFYHKLTDNLVTEVGMPLSHGYRSYTENLGMMRNVGADLMATVNIIRNDAKKIHWSVQVGSYHNKNVIVKLSEEVKRTNARYSNRHHSGSTYFEYREGYSVDELYVLESPGVDALTGEVLYKDADGTFSTFITDTMLKIAVGSRQPKLNGRISSSLRIGSFNLNVGFAVRAGGKKLNTTLLEKVENAYANINLDTRVLDRRWQKPGDITAFKSIKSSDNTLPNDRFVFNENTFTFNNINIMYDLPRTITQKLKMQRLSINASMSDIFYLSNIEQQRGMDYPYSIKPTFTLTATF